MAAKLISDFLLGAKITFIPLLEPVSVVQLPVLDGLPRRCHAAGTGDG